MSTLPKLVLLALLNAAPDGAVDYQRDIKPILASRCYSCHGAIKQKGGLRADTAHFLLEGGDNGPALAPGKASTSLLMRRLLGQDAKPRMPPESDGEALKPAQIELLRRWIDDGAAAPKDEQPESDPREHWAFKQPVRLPSLPPGERGKNPIDAFIVQEYERRGLVPQPPADKRILLRRVYLDLIGLPPTAAQLDAFAADSTPDAYEKAIDHLLASPQYGERWGRHWMDIWRYSDWWGLGAELRNSQKHMWHWRDWIVDSLNQDKGYDRMVLEMLAADELYPTDSSALRGTGFLARHYFKFNRTTWLDEAIEHTGKAFLGLTINCGKCHDHKYDPISQLDYYRFRAIFEPYQIRLDQTPGETDLDKNGVPRVFDCNLEAPTWLHVRGNEQQPDKSREIRPGLPRFFDSAGFVVTPITLPAEAQNPGLRPFVLADHLRVAEKELEAARQQVKEAKAPALAEKAVAAAEATMAALTARAAADRSGAKELAKEAALAEKKLAVAKAELELARIEHQPPKDKAEAALKQARANVEAARKALANPGEAYTPLAGALKTLESNLESDAARRKPFPKTSTGRRAALAKWIANRDNPLTARVAVNHIWARHFGQPLVASVFDFGRKGIPPTHPALLDWLALEFMDSGWSMKHLHRLMVTSSIYRMTSSVGQADATTAKTDPDNRYLWRMNSLRMESQVVRDSLLHLAGELDLTLGGPTIETAQQEASRRRSLYFFHSAIMRNRFLTTFDDADPLDCYRRRESIVPQQALALSNSALALSMADKIARRLEAKEAVERDFAGRAFAAVLAYEPNDEELSACAQALERWRTVLDAGRARAALVHALLNHNDFVTIR